MLIKVKAKVYLILFMFCISFSGQCFASYFNNADSAINPISNHKKTKQYYLDYYGKDDSTRALIEYFFNKKHNSINSIIIWGITGIASTLLLLYLTNGGYNLGIIGFLLYVDLIAIFYGVAIGLLISLYKLCRFNRKRLFKLLNNYNNGKGLPKNIKRNKTFINELEIQKILK